MTRKMMESVNATIASELGIERNEIEDEMLGLVSGGRSNMSSELQQYVLNKRMSRNIHTAISSYLDYVKKLPEGSKEVLFEIDNWTK